MEQGSRIIIVTHTTGNLGFASILMVVVLSLSLMLTMISIGQSKLNLLNDSNLMSIVIQRQLAAEVCVDFALYNIALDPNYSATDSLNIADGATCTIDAVSHSDGSSSPFADRVIQTTGSYEGQSVSMTTIAGVSNTGVILKSRHFK